MSGGERNNASRYHGGGRHAGFSVVRNWMDMYGAPPVYEYPNFTSYLGIVMTIITIASTLFYIGVTLRDYVMVAPEVVVQGTEVLPQQANITTFPIPQDIGVGIEYIDQDGVTQNVNVTNLDRYFRFDFFHMTIQQQDKIDRIYRRLNGVACPWDTSMMCIDPTDTTSLQLQGRYLSDVYQYIEVNVAKCGRGFSDNNPHIKDINYDCAPDDEIDAIIAKQAKIRIHFKYEEFDPTHYHGHSRAVYEHKTGQAVYTIPHERRLFLLPDRTIRTEVDMRGRRIWHERRHTGSPPFPQTLTQILTFLRFEDVLSMQDTEGELAEFFFHIDEETTVEETSYWMPSVLDLFGAWGAVFAFFTQLSLGLVATVYNRWRYYRSFKHKARDLTFYTETNRKRRPGFASVVEETIAQRVAEKAPDLRLFDKDHFDEHGRLCVTAEEFSHPTSLYGELRAYAIFEHKKKVRAAATLLRTFRRVQDRKQQERNGTTSDYQRRKTIRDVSSAISRRSKDETLEEPEVAKNV